MSLFRFIPELPLLRRELTELSARRRTYIIRFIGAVLLLGWFVFVLDRAVEFAVGSAATLPPTQRFQAMLGMGGNIIRSIVPSLFHCVQLLMPAMICGSIAMEKERNTIGTLFVTRLSPMTIVLEKFISRLVPMFTFLFLTFPLLALLYSLGGVDHQMVFAAAWLLLGECMCFAAVGLLCSAWFGTTVSAFIGSYVLCGVFVVVTQVIGLRVFSPFCLWEILLTPYVRVNGPITGFIPTMRGIMDMDPQWGIVKCCLWFSLPWIAFVGSCLALTRFLLFRRAFVGHSSLLLRIFRRVDKFFTDLNNRTTGGVVLVKDGESLPLFDPIAWRERTKKSLGKARYLIRILVLLEGPVLFLCLLSITMTANTNTDPLRVLLALVWGLAILVIMVKASTIITAERSRETLDALLSTPISSAQLLREKVVGMRRLMIVLATPIITVHLTLIVMYASFGGGFFGSSFINLLLYMVTTTLATATLMHTVAWVSVLTGLRSSTQAKSVASSAIVLVTWVFVSYVFLGPYRDPVYGYAQEENPGLSLMTVFKCIFRFDGWICANEGLLSSLSSSLSGYNYSIMIWHEIDGDPGTAIVAVTIVGLAHIGIMFGIRQFVLMLASWLLNRRDQSASDVAEVRRFPHLQDGAPVLPLSEFSAEMQRSRG